MWKYTRGTPREQNEVFQEVMSSTNYKGKVKTRGDFDPFSFSLESTRTAVREALNSKASVRTGPKLMNHPFSLDALMGETTLNSYGKMKKGQSFIRSFEDGKTSFQSEIVSTERRDRMSKALCAYCGNPNDLKACSGCRKVWYCGREHQRSVAYPLLVECRTHICTESTGKRTSQNVRRSNVKNSNIVTGFICY
jgi:hypothetical protein